MTLRTMDEYGVRKLLRKTCDKLGGIDAFAREHGFSEPYIKHMIVGNITPSTRIIKILGLMPVTRYAKQPKGRAA